MGASGGNWNDGADETIGEATMGKGLVYWRQRHVFRLRKRINTLNVMQIKRTMLRALFIRR